MIRKVFVSNINYDHPQTGMNKAFEGFFGKENVTHYDYFQRARDTNYGMELVNDEFLQAAVNSKPDWMWLQLQNTAIISAKTIQKVRDALPKCVITHWMGDCRHEVDDYLASICKVTDVTFTSSIGYLGLYLAAGATIAKYLQIGLDWDEDVLGLPAWDPPYPVPDVVFIGNHYGDRFPATSQREAAARALFEAGINVGVVGDGWGKKGVPIVGNCTVKQQHHVWKRAKVGISVNHYQNIEGYYSDRHLIAMASGTPLVCQYIPKLEEHFKNNEELAWFNNTDELRNIVKNLLENPSRRAEIGAAGRRKVIKDHTWFNRIQEVYCLIEDLARRKA